MTSCGRRVVYQVAVLLGGTRWSCPWLIKYLYWPRSYLHSPIENRLNSRSGCAMIDGITINIVFNTGMHELTVGWSPWNG